MRIIRALQRQRFAVRNLPKLPDRMNQFGQSELPTPERLADTVFHDPAFEVNDKLWALSDHWLIARANGRLPRPLLLPSRTKLG